MVYLIHQMKGVNKQMAKYLVRCEKIWEDWVEAENEDEAMDLAEERFYDDDVTMDIYIEYTEEDEDDE